MHCSSDHRRKQEFLQYINGLKDERCIHSDAIVDLWSSLITIRKFTCIWVLIIERPHDYIDRYSVSWHRVRMYAINYILSIFCYKNRGTTINNNRQNHLTCLVHLKNSIVVCHLDYDVTYNWRLHLTFGQDVLGRSNEISKL